MSDGVFDASVFDSSDFDIDFDASTPPTDGACLHFTALASPSVGLSISSPSAGISVSSPGVTLTIVEC